jgi:hypothetical protein
MKQLLLSIPWMLCVAGCSSSTDGATGPGTDDGGTDTAVSSDTAVGGDTAVPADSASDAAADASGDGATGSGSATLTGTYGGAAILPVVAAYWIGKPNDPTESAGGPFLYLFSGPVTCDDLSHGSGWRARIPAGTQVLELIVGTTKTATPVPAAAHAAADVVEANYSFGGSTAEARATSGNVTLTAYVAATNVDGTVDLTFPSGSAKGTFHAVYCATGNEL